MDDMTNAVAQRTASGANPRSKHKKGLPFSLFIVKYFIYVLIGAVFAAGMVVSLLIVAVDSGVLYPSNYASVNYKSMVGEIESRGTVGADDVPSCYRWGSFDDAGRLVEGDLDARLLDFAEEFLQEGAEDSIVYSSPVASPVYAARAELSNGGTCVLLYDYDPEFVSKPLRDAFPDPQGAMLLTGAVLFVAFVAFVAMRASSMLRRKLSPLVDAARRIGDRKLDFDIVYGNVRETNDVLQAFDDMRSSLKTSLEKQWTAEAAQREALSSLAHDLKTPLTIVRGNADLLIETNLDEEQRSSAHFIREASDDMENFIGRIIEATRFPTGPNEESTGVARAGDVCRHAAREAQALANARAGTLAVRIGDIPERACVKDGGIVQAVLNLVDNAFEYGKPPVALTCAFKAESADAACEAEACGHIGTLLIVVRDEGDGFSQAALARATERFYRDDAARTRDGHHGLGLAIAQERVRASDGELLLENREGGACVTLALPCFDGSEGKRRLP